MDALQLISQEQTDIATWDFEQLKEELTKALSEYKNIVYTDDTIKAAKEDKTKLANTKKLIEDQRKAYKAQCMAPYEAVEPKIKELVSIIEDHRTMIDNVIQDYTERQKQKKAEEVRAYYDKKSSELGDLADVLYEKIRDPKWLNASTPKTKYETEMLETIANASGDLRAIRAMNSPFVDTLLETYGWTFSLEAVKEKNRELLDAAEKAGLNRPKEEAVAEPGQPEAATAKAEARTNPAEGVTVRIFASQGQLNQIYDFMKAIGADFEIQ